jgi:hypothetical protein
MEGIKSKERYEVSKTALEELGELVLQSRRLVESLENLIKDKDEQVAKLVKILQSNH